MLGQLQRYLIGVLLIGLLILSGVVLYQRARVARADQQRSEAQTRQQQAEAKADSLQHALDQAQQFQQIAEQYETEKAHAPTPQAPAVAAGLRAGTLRLRNCAAGNVSSTAAGTGQPDAAAAGAAADGEQAAVAAVGAGDEADQREAALSAQVRALQAVVEAERR